MKNDDPDAWHRLSLLFIHSSWLFPFTQTSLKGLMQKSTRLLVMRGFQRLRIVHTFLTLMPSLWKFFGGIRSYQQVRIQQGFINPPDCCLAVPHRVMQDDIHEGYLIPKGALIIPNIWWDNIFTCSHVTTNPPYNWRLKPFPGNVYTTQEFIEIHSDLTQNGLSLQKAGHPSQIHEKFVLDSDEGKLAPLDPWPGI